MGKHESTGGMDAVVTAKHRTSQARRTFGRRAGKSLSRIAILLEGLYAKYNRYELIKPDPLQFVYRYRAPADREIAGFLSAGLAYGRVEQIEKSLNNLFARMGDSPYEFVRDFDKTKRRQLDNFKHRFTSGDDIADLLELLSEVVRWYGSIETFFLQGCSPGDQNLVTPLLRFCDSLYAIHAKRHGSPVKPGLAYLLVSPTKGSACKRLNLFLRWMVRRDAVDTGLWKSVDRAKLIVPVDVHIARLCRILGLHDSTTVSLATALKITESFAKIEPADPVKYDFALSRIGILEDCNGRYRSRCEECELFEYCLRMEGWAK
jgi:uncharacterized protein (TIGR02757 family)